MHRRRWPRSFRRFFNSFICAEFCNISIAEKKSIRCSLNSNPVHTSLFLLYAYDHYRSLRGSMERELDLSKLDSTPLAHPLPAGEDCHIAAGSHDIANKHSRKLDDLASPGCSMDSSFIDRQRDGFTSIIKDMKLTDEEPCTSSSLENQPHLTSEGITESKHTENSNGTSRLSCGLFPSTVRPTLDMSHIAVGFKYSKPSRPVAGQFNRSHFGAVDAAAVSDTIGPTTGGESRVTQGNIKEKPNKDPQYDCGKSQTSHSKHIHVHTDEDNNICSQQELRKTANKGHHINPIVTSQILESAIPEEQEPRKFLKSENFYPRFSNT